MIVTSANDTNYLITTNTGIHTIPASDFLTIGHKIHDYVYDASEVRTRVRRGMDREIIECLD